MSKQNRLAAAAANGGKKDQPKPKRVVKTREVGEVEELGLRLMTAYDREAALVQQNVQLQVEIANLKRAAALREKKILAERYGIVGDEIKMEIKGDKRILSLTVTEEEEEEEDASPQNQSETPSAEPDAVQPEA